MRFTVNVKDGAVVNSNIKINEFNLDVFYDGKGSKYLCKKEKAEILEAISRKLDLIAAGGVNVGNQSFALKETQCGRVENFVYSLIEDELKNFDKSADCDEIIVDFIKRIDFPASYLFIKALKMVYQTKYTSLNEIAYMVWKMYVKKSDSEYTKENMYVEAKKEQKKVTNTLRNDFRSWKYYPEIQEYYTGTSVAVLFKIFLKTVK